MSTIVCLLSGGLDSTVMTAYYKSQGHVIYALSFEYGQRHAKELLAAQSIALKLDVVDWKLAHVDNFLVHRGALGGDSPMPIGHYAEDNMAQTIVPNRNAVMLTQAYAWAETVGAVAVAYAAHAGDHAVYPDCRPEFFDKFAQMQRVALGHGITLLAPFGSMSKAEIVKRGVEVRAPMADTWSCYQGDHVHCGQCGTCVERAEAFHLAGVPDPTQYADPTYWRSVTKHA